METTVKVSVIIPVFNLEKYISICLDSILSQTLSEIEIICVDDGSTDGSLQLLHKYQAKDERIKVISQRNAGAGAARNAGSRIASGKYLSFLDGDDFFEADKLELEYYKAEETGSDIVVSLVDVHQEEENEFVWVNEITKQEFIPPYEPFNFRQITNSVFDTFTGWAWDKLILRSFVIENGLLFQEQRTTNDLLFTYSALIRANRISLVKKVLNHHRENRETSLSKTREKSWDCFYMALIALKEDIEKLKLMKELERDFVNYALIFTKWNLTTIKDQQAALLKDKLADGWLENLGLCHREAKYYYNNDEYKWLIENFEEACV